MLSTNVKYLLFISITGLLWTPHIVKHFHWVEEEKLNGYFEIPDSTFILKDTNWLSGDFQERYEKWFNYSMGLHLTGVRLSNQLNFWMGEQPVNAILGKDQEIMGREYIESYLGRDFIGADSINRMCSRMKLLKDSLGKHNIKFFVVIAPNKSRVRARSIPDFFHPEARGNSNYEYYLAGLEKNNIPVVNFEKWFETKDDTSRYPLFSNLGIHWSNYGALLCGDSLLKFIDHILGVPINHVHLQSVILSDKPEGTDDDMLQIMNLLIPIKPRKTLAKWNYDLPMANDKIRPDVMVIGDSFYWNINNFGISKYFSESFVYFYYNATAFYLSGGSKPVHELDLKKEILSQKLIFFIYAEPNLCNFGNGFTEKALTALSK